jgi:hypothetical protein
MRRCLPLLLACLGCASVGRDAVIGAPALLLGFPSTLERGPLRVEARCPLGDEEALGRDLLARGILPVAIRIGLRDATSSAKLDEANIDPHLYLPDGTPLDWIPARQIAQEAGPLAEAIAGRALALGWIEAWESAREGWLFFRCEPERVRVAGLRVLVRRPTSDRELELLDSLLTFNASVGSDEPMFAVGLGSSR